MRFLLDTQIWLWLQTRPERIDDEVRARLADDAADVLLSAASSWEIAIKHALGKLPLPVPPREYIPSRMRSAAVDGLPVSHAHALHVATLPHHHNDPFDRLLVAQAQLEKGRAGHCRPADRVVRRPGGPGPVSGGTDQSRRSARSRDPRSRSFGPRIR